VSNESNDPRVQKPADVKAVATRKAFGEELEALGGRDEKVVVLDADLAKSTQSQIFAKTYPDRFFEMGIQEANMLGTAAGLALAGYTPFCCSFAAFITGRFDQIKMSVAYSEARVRIVGTHAGVGIGPDGYSQQGLEDLAMMRSLSGMLVLQPADDLETRQMVDALATDPRPAYLRLTRQNVPRVHGDDYKFEAGKWPTLLDGNDVCIFATGGTVGHAVAAGLALHNSGISARVVNASSIKPADADSIESAARDCRGLVTVEDHTVLGGLGGVVAEVAAQRQPARMKMLGIQDEFGESGEPDALYAKHKIDAAGIEEEVRTFYETVLTSRA
jgi:transketolase